MILSETLLDAAAAFFVWHCLARVRPPGIAQLVPLLPRPIQHFLSCPWCSAAWISLAITLAHLLPTTASMTQIVVSWLAASAFVGIAGSLLPDDGDPDQA